MRENEFSTRQETVGTWQEQLKRERLGEYGERYVALKSEYDEITREVAVAQMLGRLRQEGAQILIEEYDTNEFFRAVSSFVRDRVEVPPSLAIVRKLEPDSKRRAALFTKMESDATKELAAFKSWQEKEDHDEHAYHYYGRHEDDTLPQIKSRFTKYRSWDASFKEGQVADDLFFVDPVTQGFKALIGLPWKELNALRQRLEAVNDDITHLIADIGQNTDERAARVNSQIETVTAEIDGQIQATSADEKQRIAILEAAKRAFESLWLGIPLKYMEDGTYVKLSDK